MSDRLNGPNLEEGEEFAVLCLKNAATKLRPHESSVLQDGLVLYGSLPFVLSDSWHKSLGELRAEQLKRSTVVVLGRNNSDATAHYLNVLFGSLWLAVSLEYEGATLLTGQVIHGELVIKTMTDMNDLRPTKGTAREELTVSHITRVLPVVPVIDALKESRFQRGLQVLMDGLEEFHGQERLHQFVRSLEALILPEKGATARQFAHRCQLFANIDRDDLSEAYDMRSDTEHLHDWTRSLSKYPAAEMEIMALHRTRQMETLARCAYLKILSDQSLRQHFLEDSALGAFWLLSDSDRLRLWGQRRDLRQMPVVRNFDSWSRAMS